MSKDKGFFNEKGEMEAWDGKDALDKIAKLLEKGVASAPTVIKSDPLLTKLSVAPLFEEDCDLEAFSGTANEVVGDHLECRSLLWKCLKHVGGDVSALWREFRVEASCNIKKGVHYDRPVEYVIQELERQEGEALRTVLEENLQLDNNLSSEEFVATAAEDLRYKIERMRLPLNKIVINRDIISDIVRNMANKVNPVTERELILLGYLSNYGNAMVITSSGYSSVEPIKPGEAYGLTNPDLVGVFGFSEKLQNKLTKIGEGEFKWDWSETLSIEIINSRGIAKWTRDKVEE